MIILPSNSILWLNDVVPAGKQDGSMSPYRAVEYAFKIALIRFHGSAKIHCPIKTVVLIPLCITPVQRVFF